MSHPTTMYDACTAERINVLMSGDDKWCSLMIWAQRNGLLIVGTGAIVAALGVSMLFRMFWLINNVDPSTRQAESQGEPTVDAISTSRLSGPGA